MAQTLGRHWRTFMYQVNRRLEHTKRVLDSEDLQLPEGHQNLEDMGQANENVYYILVEKIEGEAAMRVQSCTPGEGISAHLDIYLRFAGTSGLQLQAKGAC